MTVGQRSSRNRTWRLALSRSFNRRSQRTLTRSSPLRFSAPHPPPATSSRLFATSKTAGRWPKTSVQQPSCVRSVAAGERSAIFIPAAHAGAPKVPSAQSFAKSVRLLQTGAASTLASYSL